jgi:phospholipid transport system substrate-binding protein
MKSSLRFVWTLIAALFVVLSPRPALAEGGATSAVRRANQTLTDLLRKKPQAGSTEEQDRAKELTAKLATFLDVEELGRRALKDHYAELNAEQKREFSKLLRELVEASYVKALRAQLEYDVSYTGEKREKESVRVATEVRTQRKGRTQSMSIDYLMSENENQWRVVDLVTDGVGLVENYRAQFNRIIAKEGVNSLLARMRKKKLESG